MIRNQIVRKVKVTEGDNFFILDKGFESDLDKLPKDVMKNMFLKLREENIQLKKRNIMLQNALDEEFSTHGR